MYFVSSCCSCRNTINYCVRSSFYITGKFSI
nr:MAG TPA: hypothetical protein [Crassvirales sp.]